MWPDLITCGVPLGTERQAVQARHERRDEAGRAPLTAPEPDAELAAQLESLIGPGGRELVNSILTTTSPEGGTRATVIGLVTLLIGTTAVFGELQTTMNLIREVCPTVSFASRRAVIPSAGQRLPDITMGV